MPELRSVSDSFEVEVFNKLKEAELEVESTEKRYTHEEVVSDLRSRVVDSTVNKK